MLRMRTILKGKLHTRPPPPPPPLLYAETSDASTKSHRVGSELLLVIHTRTRAVWQDLYMRKCILPPSLQPDLGMTSTLVYLIKIFISVF